MNRLTATLCLTLVLLLGSAGVSWSADFQKGVTAYRSGDYATAIREFQPLAEQGISDAQYNLGLLYENGWGVSKDNKTAVKWYTLGTEQGRQTSKIDFLNCWLCLNKSRTSILSGLW